MPDNTSTVGLCSPSLNDGVSPIQGLLVEFVISFMLTLVCCGVWDCRNNTKHDSVPIRFGLAIAVLALAGVNNTFNFEFNLIANCRVLILEPI